ncbi:DUF1648 domain-containing protein [Cohnella sp. JJ-181]|uniref:DUF1648 domain-containing protein n=1 Tax=Cohnella rhizoplanae TaxID=2974897 RepID=UPI0022FFBEA8|nr:DUF5808 domain-containing protein [Cohnella sp. JJ-181]CAI6082992.1 hypothetical protein COHCIP112018_03833 [Cohnella sp. JJ-181]
MSTIQTEWLVLGIVDVVMSLTLAAAFFIAPRYLLFGLYVPEADRDRPEVRRIRARHNGAMVAVWTLGLGVGALTGAWSGDGYKSGSPETALWIALVIQIGGLIPIWRSGRVRALRLKQAGNWNAEKPSKIVIDLLFRQRQRLVGNGWFLVHLAIVAAGVLSAVLHWDAIPDPVPTHFGISGEADDYSSKGFGSVFALNFVQLAMVAVFLLVNLSIRQARQQLDPARPEASRENQLRFRKANSVFVYAISLFVVVMLGLGQSVTLYGWPATRLSPAMLGLPALLIVAVFGFVWYVARQGLDDTAGSGARIQEDEVWRGGGWFYYNKADPSLMVEKRYGIGWTINFAHPLGIAIFAGMLLVPIAIVIVTVTLT